ncbi:hypothetical protein WOLCODRAFT_162386 [Wolfiporia cocos MD-104 SS10]|uniref:Geranylgeranyl pyrophosphate synthetase n=1 Tax=Wolfiporia cocos (strain MD-104) TaxID=742152 RepID=A0A2H3JNV4_WOLCO|nr:hypothetical protein WOLCODRAFT_162386 [Wolfiporia cocos MD-104 SS10]
MASPSSSRLFRPILADLLRANRPSSCARVRHAHQVSRKSLPATPVLSLRIPEAAPEAADVKIDDSHVVGSYSWVRNPEPTISVPGRPFRWRARPIPFMIQPDKGEYVIDDNCYRMPASPLLPLFCAVDTYADAGESNVDWPTVDFVVDVQVLESLLKWIRGHPRPGIHIDAQLAGTRSVLLSRRMDKPTVEYNKKFHGDYNYDFAYLAESTVSNREHSTYQRIINYASGAISPSDNMNGLNMVVRHEGDSYIPVTETPTARAGLHMKEHVPGAIHRIDNLRISRGGYRLQPSSLLEVSCRTQGNADTLKYWAGMYPHVFFSQIPQIYTAIVHCGRVRDIVERELNDKTLTGVNARMQEDFKKLKLVLDAIQQLVVSHGKDGRLCLVDMGSVLQVLEKDDKTNCVSEAILARFDRQE